jgi:glutathione synthase
VILVRQDPPFDLNYFTNTHLLDRTKARVINSTKGLREVSEKLSVLHFPDFIPKTLLTYSVLDVLEFLKEHKKAVLKPLYECGGRGISLLTHGGLDVFSALNAFQQQYAGPFLIQEFLPSITTQGDKWIFIIDGEPILGYQRTPQNGSILANLCQNATATPYAMTQSDIEICTIIGMWLKEQDIFLAGVDLIGNRLIEINVTSPTGFRTAQDLYGINLASLFWSKLLKTV